MRGVPYAELILQIAFSRDSFSDQAVLLCLAPRESRWRPIFRTPLTIRSNQNG